MMSMIPQKIGALLILLATIIMWAARYKNSRRKRMSPRALLRVRDAKEGNSEVVCEQMSDPRLLWVSFILLVIVGVLDLILLYACEPTITNWVQSVCPTHWLFTYGSMLFIATHTWLVFGIRGLIPTLVGTIAGHFFW